MPRTLLIRFVVDLLWTGWCQLLSARSDVADLLHRHSICCGPVSELLWICVRHNSSTNPQQIEVMEFGPIPVQL